MAHALKKVEKKKSSRCAICNHPDRDGIEIVGMMAASNFRIAATRINNTFGTDFTPKQVQNHLQNHELHARAAEDFGEVYESLMDESQPMVTPANVLRTLLVQGMQDVAKGKIRVNNVQQLLQVLTTYQNLRRQERLDLMMEDGDAGAFYAAMAAYGQAVQSVVGPEQTAEIVRRANALGAKLDFSHVPDYPERKDRERTLAIAVRDMETLGRPRTRQELEDDGVFDAIPPDIIE